MLPSAPVIVLWVSSPETDQASSSYAYGVAGYILVSNQPVAEIAHFILPDSPSLPAPLSLPETAARFSHASPPQSSRLVFDGLAWWGGRQRHITSQATDEAIWLTNPEAGVAVVSHMGQQITLLLSPTNERADLPLLGPALVLALALQGVFCLHASAVVAGDRLVAFLGESGRGKSTLAAYLARDWRRLADDMLPLAAGKTAPALACLPFPQPLADLVEISAAMPLSAAYVLDDGELSLQTLPPAAATLALARHTVAARLFPPNLLAHHFSFCAQLAAAIPVKSLRYRRCYTALPAVRQAIAADLSGIAPSRAIDLK